MDQQPVLPPDGSVPSADGDRRRAERRQENRGKLERVSVRGLFAVLLACIAIGFAALAIWQAARAGRTLGEIRDRESQLIADNARLREGLTTLSGRLDANTNRVEELGALAPRLSELGDSLAELRDRTEGAQRAWTHAEAHYLLEIANRRLTLDRDWGSALAALEAADERLKSLKDPSLNPTRRALASEIQALRNVVQPDIPGITARLASAEEIAGSLPVLGAIQENYSPDRPVAGSPPGLARAWQVIRASLVGMVSIRRIGDDAVELVSFEEQNVGASTCSSCCSRPASPRRVAMRVATRQISRRHACGSSRCSTRRMRASSTSARSWRCSTRRQFRQRCLISLSR